MKFDIAEFKRFAKSLEISTKEFGIVKLGDQWRGTQEYFIQEVAKALAEDRHYIVVLKGRQVMISTACLALDLYWHFKYPGTSGTLITDTEENREMFRATLAEYIESLPNEWKQPINGHNRTQLIIGNRSRIAYQVAGTKRKEKRSVGVGKAVMFMHATECANWGDDAALADIEASLAQINPNRLYIFESTARGYNGFYDMWETAKRARTQAAIFVGWWRNDLYRKEKDSPEYNVYWDGRFTADETRWIREVKRVYDFDICAEQIAWWRWMLAEHIHEEARMFQEYPPTEEDAFVVSGSQFFNSMILTDRMKIAKQKEPDNFRVVMGEHYEATEIIDANDDTATLKIWRLPRKGAFYAIGADPAYGSSEWADRFCASVWECYADGMEQVAEFCTEQCQTYQFAWLLCYLAGAYGPAAEAQVMLNLEINGPGMHVWSEIQNMKRSAGMSGGVNAGVGTFLANIQNYLYRRPDSLGGGYNYHWKSDSNTKERMFNAFKDGFERGIVVVNSDELITEMKHVVRDEGQIGVPGRGKDDRVVAGCLATVAWHDFIRMRLMQLGWTKEKAHRNREQGSASPTERAVFGYLARVGITEET